MIHEACEQCVLINNYQIDISEQDKTKKYVLILDNPDMSEASLNRPFTNQSAKLLSNLLSKYGLSFDDFYLTYAVKCSSKDSKETEKASRKCKEILYEELKQLPNLEFIITFGSIACNLVTHKRGSLKKNMNLPQKITVGNKEVRVLPTVHPNLIYHDPNTIDHISQAFNVFTTLIREEYETPKPTPIEINDTETFKEVMMEIYEADHVGFDVETTSNAAEKGLKIFDPSFRILTIGIAIKDKAYWLNVSHSEATTHEQWAKQLVNACKDKIIAHNRIFDVLASIRYFNIHDFKGDDTLVIAYILDENAKKGLKHLASQYLGWHEYDMEVQTIISGMKKSSMPDYENIPVKILGVYNALDAAATLRIYDILYNKLSTAEKDLYTFLMEIQNIYIECTLNGMLVDIQYIAKLKQELNKQSKEIYEELSQSPKIQAAKKVIKAIEDKTLDTDLLLSSGKIKYLHTPSEDIDNVEINLNSRHHLMAILAVLSLIPEELTATGNISTSRSSLENLVTSKNDEQNDLIQKILKYKKLTKLSSTFIKGLNKQIYPDGKVHPFFSLTNTVTGRTSSSNPNVQQIPRDKEIKNIFYVPEGFKMVQYDFAQAEIRVMASFANDKALISAINSGADIHIAVASLMFDIPINELTKESPERQIAKSCSFGILYGTGPLNLAEMIGSTKEDAQEKIQTFMKRFPEVQQWINTIHKKVMNYGHVSTPFGRKRRLPMIWSADDGMVSSAKRQAQNSPIQATASDLNLWLFAYIIKHMDKEKAQALCSVHDSGVFMVHDSYVEEFINLLKKGEDKLNKVFTFLKVPVIIDIQVGERWGSMKDIEEEKGEIISET